MLICNRTGYNTAELRALFEWAMEKRGAQGQAGGWWYVNYSRRRKNGVRQPHGRATLGGWAVWVYLPRGNTNGYNLAQVVLHEIDHNLGLKHREMPTWYQLRVDGLPAKLHWFTEGRVAASGSQRNLRQVT